MAAVDRLVIATGNAGKLAEFRQLLKPMKIEVVGQRELGIIDPDETGLSFVENALIKARHASLISGWPALADDSGLCVDALGGAPGLYSARYAGADAPDADNIRRLLGEMESVENDRRGAHFVCVLTLVHHPRDPDPLIASGRWQGRILRQPQGTHGFGYDPVFFDPELQRTAAELDATSKHARSHRGRAIKALLAGIEPS